MGLTIREVHGNVGESDAPDPPSGSSFILFLGNFGSGIPLSKDFAKMEDVGLSFGKRTLFSKSLRKFLQPGPHSVVVVNAVFFVFNRRIVVIVMMSPLGAKIGVEPDFFIEMPLALGSLFRLGAG